MDKKHILRKNAFFGNVSVKTYYFKQNNVKNPMSIFGQLFFSARLN